MIPCYVVFTCCQPRVDSSWSYTNMIKSIGLMVLLITSITPIRMQLIPSTEEPTQIPLWLILMICVFKKKEVADAHPLSP